MPEKMMQNCLSYWFPKIEAAGLPVPDTRIVDAGDDWHEMSAVMDGVPSPVFDRAVRRIDTESKGTGTPFFLRTGFLSGKHRWGRTCFVSGMFRLEDHVRELVEASELSGIIGLPYRIWAVREMLPVEPLFRCRTYGGMPVCREFRVFVRDDRILYRIPYWPAGAAERGQPHVADWLRILQGAACLTSAEAREIDALAARAGAAVGGEWSVDVLWTRRGWYITDMARAEESWGWDEDKAEGEAC